VQVKSKKGLRIEKRKAEKKRLKEEKAARIAAKAAARAAAKEAAANGQPVPTPAPAEKPKPAAPEELDEAALLKRQKRREKAQRKKEKQKRRKLEREMKEAEMRVGGGLIRCHPCMGGLHRAERLIQPLQVQVYCHCSASDASQPAFSIMPL
jgi:type IV secretory pathway VirB10-like protein